MAEGGITQADEGSPVDELAVGSITVSIYLIDSLRSALAAGNIQPTSLSNISPWLSVTMPNDYHRGDGAIVAGSAAGDDGDDGQQQQDEHQHPYPQQPMLLTTQRHKPPLQLAVDADVNSAGSSGSTPAANDKEPAVTLVGSDDRSLSRTFGTVGSACAVMGCTADELADAFEYHREVRFARFRCSS
jgi:hypothetical protein